MGTLSKYLRSSTNKINANGDYSSAQGSFFLTAPAKTTYKIDHLTITIEDVTPMTTALYGGVVALSNGVQLRVVRAGGAVEKINDEEVITTNSDLAGVCDDFKLITFSLGNEILKGKITFSSPIVLSPGDKIEALFDDNLQGLVTHKFFVTGEIVAKFGA